MHRTLKILSIISLAVLVLTGQTSPKKESSKKESSKKESHETAHKRNDGSCWNYFLCRAFIKPNQCPVCGTMAESYRREFSSSGMLTNCRPVTNPPNGLVNLMQCDEAKKIPISPPERLTRCKRCNAAFYQDSVN